MNSNPSSTAPKPTCQSCVLKPVILPPSPSPKENLIEHEGPEVDDNEKITRYHSERIRTPDLSDLRKPRVVASLTTMPDRYHKLVKTLRCLNNQEYPLDAIYLSIPYRCKRLDIEYPEIPDEITELCTVIRCEDHGPITKILGALLTESDPDTVVITFDDDMIYPKDLVATLMYHHNRHPNCALGSSGMLLKYNCPMCAITPNEHGLVFRIPKFPIPIDGRRVDCIYGYPGALYLRKFFPEKALLNDFLYYATVNSDMFINDDITISGWLSLKDVERRIYSGIPEVTPVVDDVTGERVRSVHEISYDMDKFFHRLNGAIVASKALGMYAVTEPLSIDESIVGVAFLLFIPIIILIVLCIFFIWF